MICYGAVGHPNHLLQSNREHSIMKTIPIAVASWGTFDCQCLGGVPVKKRSLVLSLAMLVFFGGAGMAGATCVQEGKVSRLRSIPGQNIVDIQQLQNLPAFATF